MEHFTQIRQEQYTLPYTNNKHEFRFHKNWKKELNFEFEEQELITESSEIYDRKSH